MFFGKFPPLRGLFTNLRESIKEAKSINQPDAKPGIKKPRRPCLSLHPPTDTGYFSRRRTGLLITGKLITAVYEANLFVMPTSSLKVRATFRSRINPARCGRSQTLPPRSYTCVFAVTVAHWLLGAPSLPQT